MFFMPKDPPTLAVSRCTFSFGTFEVLGEIGPVAGDALGRDLDGVALAGLVVGGERRARLHRHHGDAGVDDVEFGHMGGAGKSGLDLGGVAIVIIQRHIVGDVIVELRRAGLGGFRGVGDGGQGIDIEHHGFAGVARLRQRLGDHEGDGIADIAHLVGHQRACGWSAAAASRRGSSAAGRR